MNPQISLIDPGTYERNGIPHDQLSWLRQHAPVFWHSDGGGGWPGFWAVTRHDDVEYVSRHPDTFSSHRRLALFNETPDDQIDLQRLMMLNMDPPQHTRQRGFVNRGFTPRMIRQLDVLLLTVAGNETTRNAASGGMLALFEHPDQWARLCADPGLAPTAAEEIVRWVSPVNLFRRTATRDTEVRGQRIAEGDKVVVFYSSANRDDSVFGNPFRFDLGRSPNPHVGFGGGGPHFCLGRHLAALELQVLLRTLTRRMPDIELAGRPRRLRSNFINGIKEMPVRFTRSRPTR